MSKVKFYLEVRSSGVNKQDKNSFAHIRLVVKLLPNSPPFKKFLSEKVRIRDWNKKTQRPRKTYQEYNSLKYFLDQIEIKFNDAWRRLMIKGQLNKLNMSKSYDKIFGIESDTVFYYFRQIAKLKNNPMYDRGLEGKYNNVIDKVYEYNNKLTFNDVDKAFFHGFTKLLFTKYGVSTNTAAGNLSIFRAMMTACIKDGHCSKDNDTYLSFKIKKRKTFFPYLCEADLKKLYDQEYADARIRNARNLILLGCWSGQRFGDWNKLKESSLVNYKGRQYFQLLSEKTNEPIYIPSNKKFIKIIKQGVNHISSQKANPAIKEACRIAGINSKFVKPSFKKNIHVDTEFEKWELITSHTGRRSFATNSLMSGVPKYLIMKVTGHAKEKTFDEYVQLTSMDGLEQFSSD